MRYSENKIHVKAVSSVQGKIWFHKLAKQAGGRTPYWFAKHCNCGSRHTTTWKRYRSGKRPPRIHNRVHPVAELAKQYPYSGNVFWSPLWRILKHEDFSDEDIDREFSKLSLTHRAIVQGRGLWLDIMAEDGSVPTQDVLAQLSKIPEFETLEVILLLMKSADRFGNHQFRGDLDDLYRQMIPDLLLHADIPFIGELFDLIDGFSCHRQFSHALGTQDTRRSWRSELPRYGEALTQHYTAGLKISDGFVGLNENFFTAEMRREIAEFMVEYVRKDEALFLQSAELWRPMSWAHTQLIRGRIDGQDMSGDRFNALMRDEIAYHLGEKEQPKSGNEFSVVLRG